MEEAELVKIAKREDEKMRRAEEASKTWIEPTSPGPYVILLTSPGPYVITVW